MMGLAALEEEEERVWYFVIAARADSYILHVILGTFRAYAAFVEPGTELGSREC